MAISVAQFRQQLPSFIAAAQLAPQFITKHDAPVAVLVSPAYFEEQLKRAQNPGAFAAENSFHAQLMQLRFKHPQGDGPELSTLVGARRSGARANSFAVASADGRRKA